MIDIILRLLDLALLVLFIFLLFDLARTKQQVSKYRKELVQLCNKLRAENMLSTGRIPSAIPDDSLDASVYRCNICGNDMWRSRDCLHWPGITYIIEEDDKRREVKCVPIAEEKGRDQ